jgi:predicted DNA-binding transcriptional regulator AlpA
MQQYIPLERLRQKLGGRSRSTIYNDMAAGRLPLPLKLGRKLYWDEAAVDAHLRALAAEAPTKKGAA